METNNPAIMHFYVKHFGMGIHMVAILSEAPPEQSRYDDELCLLVTYGIERATYVATHIWFDSDVLPNDALNAVFSAIDDTPGIEPPVDPRNN